MAADTCKNCVHCGSTYKGGWCRLKGKRVKFNGSCEEHVRKTR